MGYWAAKFLERDGGIVTTVIERDTAIFKASGIDVEDAKQHVIKHGSFKGYEDKVDVVKKKDHLSMFENEVDYLVPAATEKSIHMHNADKIKCKAVFEGANGPTTFAGEEILNSKGIVVAPDMLVNGGGVTCSYFEWLKNIQHVSPGQLTKRFDK